MFMHQYFILKQNIIDVLKMEKKGLDEIGIDEILEKIKEQSPGSVVSVLFIIDEKILYILFINYILTLVIRRSLLKMHSLLLY